LCLTVAMSDNSEEPEVELYEEVVGDEYWNSPVRDHNIISSPVASASAKATTFHGPTFIIDGSRRTVEATETFAHASRPDPRDYTELAEAPKEVPRYNDGVAATSIMQHYLHTRVVKMYMSVISLDHAARSAYISHYR